MKKIMYTIISLCLIFSVSSAFGKASLGNIRAYIDKDYEEFITELSFKGAIDLSKVEISHDENKVIVTLPNVGTQKKEAKLDIDDSEVKEIKVIKKGKNVTVSLFFDKKINANQFEGYTRVEKDGNLIRLGIKRHAYVAQQNKIRKEILRPVSLDSESVEKTNISDEKLIAVDYENKEESEIPVLAKVENKKEKAESSLVSRLSISLGVIFCFAFGLFFFMRWWAKNHKAQDIKGKIRVLTQHHLGPKKTLTIIRVAGETILIGVTDSNINHIKTLSLLDNEIPDTVPANFKAELDSNFDGEEEIFEDEEFSYGESVKNTISKRLKGLGL